MGPEVMAGLALASAGLGAAGTVYAAKNQADTMRQQAEADKTRAAIESDWLERRALEERGAGQRAASEELRKAKIAQSRLTALAGGSGSGATDPTVMDLWGDIEKEGQYNAKAVQTGAEQKGAGMNYQANLDRWTADANARIKSAAANRTLIGGLLSGAGQFGSAMASRYRVGNTSVGSGGATGYG